MLHPARRRRGRRLAALTLGSALLSFGTSALGAGNDLVLHRLGSCVDAACSEVQRDDDAFRQLTRDLGLAFSPKGLAPPETLGEAGFNYGFELIFNTVDSSAISDGGAEPYWQTAVEDRDPSDILMVSQLHIRKGLPFSFELGAVLSHLFQSSMWGLGVELAWAFHEDTYWPVPDFGVRGFVSNVVGSTDLNLTLAGFDLMLGIPIGISNLYSLTPYAGWNYTAIFASSRLLDKTPGDNTPPFQGSGGTASVKPEFVFDDTRQQFNRFVGGLRFGYAVVNLTLETSIGADVQSYALHLGLDF